MFRTVPIALFALMLSALIFGATPASALEAPLPRHPAPSPDGSLIAFSWQGDLWIVDSDGGSARRLTAHPAAERHPIWSNNGRWLAFASDRHGNDDIFIVPVDGSAPPRRLTHASVTDTPNDFSPDDTRVIFSSSRADSIRWMPALYSVPVDGGTPTRVQDAMGSNARYSQDGSSMAFVRGATKWSRRGYRGAANRQLYLNPGDEDYVRLTDFDGDDDYPSWIDPHTLAFLSSRNGRKNLFLLDLVTQSARQLTSHEGSDLRFPRASADGSLIAYEFEDRIWTLDPHVGTPSLLHIDVPADQLVNPVQRLTKANGADELAIHPDGKIAAFVVHGDIFITEILSKDDQEIARPHTVQVTTHPSREKDLSWSPDGEQLLFTSARNGNDDLFVATRPDTDTSWIETFDFDITPIVVGDAEEHSGRFAPDGERIAFIRDKGDLVVAPLDGGDETVLFEHWNEPDFDWSPDSQWIVYSLPDPDYNHEISLIPAAGGTPYNISRHPDDDLSPRFSPDGKRIIWRSKRHADTFDIWAVWLQEEDHERSNAQWLKMWRQDKAAKKAKKDDQDSDDTESDDDEETKEEAPEVVIDFDRLWERSTAITSLKGDEGPAIITTDGKTIVFSADFDGDRDLYSVRWDGEELERLTKGGQQPYEIQLSKKGKKLFYLNSKGVIKRVGLDGKAGDPVPFSAHLEIDRNTERAIVFDEAWRALNQWFYDPDFHGVDWQDRYATYRPWALAASHPKDFADIMNLLIGELNASHMRYSNPTEENDTDEKTGWIGAVFAPEAGGPGILIREVLDNTPATREDVKLKAGNRILAVNGQATGPSVNIFSLFADTIKRRVILDIEEEDGTQRQATLIPFAYRQQRQARYEAWVRQRRAIVDELSDGRLGYLHIQGMNIPSFEEFERDLTAAGDGKEGLIIDVRSNGGGWTTDYLVAVLNVQRHAYTIPRDADESIRAYPQSRLPLAAWTKPALTLCNEDSYSNAEIFSWAFQTLERGLLVGSPTFGAVISTSGTRLLNGGWVRLPLRGWYVAGSGTNMELNGARPDVLVWGQPSDDTAATTDTQLEKAVSVFLEGIENDPRHGAW